ncbi:SRPBCC family protein [Peterkaempfera bronchialis]|uniref:SRPBCC family protein n=1 Tax=Peterkaempfera bronchialis TaxID=2126346 RepID=A0A345STX9_9ACTN|nr:SRPBCC family protein [Peterkaempfera bronchialis]AXI77184.1 SRPBCC family protein [Peterkaempfera bronchialis]
MEDTVTGVRVDVATTVGVRRERLWELITDVSRTGEWSPECTGAAWLDGDAAAGSGAQARVGARFEGRNRYPDGFVSRVVCVVTEAERPSAFAWVVLDDSGDPERPASIWRYELLPAAEPRQTLVRHSFEHGPGNSGARVADRHDPGSMAGRLEQLRGNMAATLAAMVASEQDRCGPAD